MEVNMSQSKEHINKDWVLLNSQSTIDLFCNALLLINICKVSPHLKIFCNTGKTTTNMVGDLPEYCKVWYYANGIANIISLNQVAERFHVTYNNHEENCFVVWKENRLPRRFMPIKRGLYYCNLKEVDGTILATIDTVDGNKSIYTQKQINYTESSRKSKIQSASQPKA